MPKKEPLRQCCACREMKNRRELIRVVRSPEGEIALDAKGRSPGRGAYLCLRAECLARGRKSKSFERAFKCKIPPEIYDNIEEALRSDE